MSEIDDILKAMLSDNKNENATSEETSGTENEEKFTKCRETSSGSG